jgi:hypothetical protein
MEHIAYLMEACHHLGEEGPVGHAPIVVHSLEDQL